MKMKSYYMLLPVAAMLGSCSLAKLATPDKLDGAWSITEVRGQKITEGDPYIGFDAAAGRVYGNSGCNRILGSYDANGKAGSLPLDKLGSTRMMCPDMSTERLVLGGLSQVNSFTIKGNVATLTDADGKTVAILQRRCAALRKEKLDGSWSVVAIRGEAVPTDLNEQPFIAFDTEEDRFSGSDGCNTFNGEAKIDGQAMTLSSVIATLMACPDVAIEGQVLEAINHVSKFGQLPNGNVGLFDDSDMLLLELKKK